MSMRNRLASLGLVACLGAGGLAVADAAGPGATLVAQREPAPGAGAVDVDPEAASEPGQPRDGAYWVIGLTTTAALVLLLLIVVLARGARATDAT